MASSKSKVAAGLLGIFLGWLGIHKFYLGDKKMGAIRLCISVVGYILLFAGTFMATAALMNGGSGGGGLALTGIGWLAVAAMSIWGLVDGIMILVGKVSADADGNPLV